jgi:hypothetical protein
MLKNEKDPALEKQKERRETRNPSISNKKVTHL